MDITIEIDLGHAARELNLPLESVQRTVALLDEGNTVPFITRYRKDQTGALDEEQIRRIQEKLGKLRGLADRKQTILRSIQSQDVLNPELVDQIRNATSLKRLEDLYLPYKPKKQTLATTARQRGLEPLAREVVDADPAAADLQQRCAGLVAPEQDLHAVDDVLAGVRHIIAEWFSERADVRGRLRKILQHTGKLVCSRIEPAKPGGPAAAEKNTASEVPTSSTAAAPETTASETTAPETTAPETATPEAAASETAAQPDPDSGSEAPAVPPEASQQVPSPAVPEPLDERPVDGPDTSGTSPASSSQSPPGGDSLGSGTSHESSHDSSHDSHAEQTKLEGSELPVEEAAGASEVVQPPTAAEAATDVPPAVALPDATVPVGGEVAAASLPMPARQKKKSKRGPLSAAISKKEKKRQRLEAAFKDYYDFHELVSRIPSHRVLAINRGERARILRVKIEADAEAMTAEAESLLIAPDHPHAEFLKGCVRDALCRLLIPSLERELRREMTEKAEEHAVDVFARNLRKLLLQPPVHNHRVLAIDPGFRSGCKLIALDEFGNVLAHDIIHVIGKEEWIRSGRNKLIELIRRHHLSVVAIGNGAGCRETEQLVVAVMENELKDDDVAFVIVNEAGASVYSTSPLGREELPSYDAVLRSAISIGRRLLDPLSELVKINPANIGVGMYQHDVKAKHLRTSLDAVVESCVNYVGVDVNTASPALLRYVSGMNQLTARRLCEYRAKHGPFLDREQLRQIPGMGEATFVQAAGFLKVTNGGNPLDATWIHPESYELAERVLEKSGCSVEDLRAGAPPAGLGASRPSMFGQLDPLVPDVEAPLAATGTPATDPPAAEVDVAHVAPSSEAAMKPPATERATEPAADVGDSSGDARAAETLPSGSPMTAAEGMVEDRAGSSAAASQPESALPESQEQAEPPATQSDEPSASFEDAVAPFPSSEVVTPEVQQAQEGAAQRLRILYDRVHQLDVSSLAGEWGVSEILLRDILNSLARPGRDPREDLPAPVFRHGIVKLEDLEPGMRLAGTVLNVVDFGAFVDIGLSDSGLVHISRLADRFVRDPHEVVGVGDVLTVWVVDIDKQRRRVSLTAIEPGTEKPAEARRKPDQQRPRRPAAKRPPRPAQADQQTGGKAQGRPPRDRSREQTRPPRKPKVVVPITKEMEEGKEPLRSFSDLMQFYQKKQTDGNKH